MKRTGTLDADDLRRREQARMVRNWTVRDFVAILDADGIRRGYVVYENGEIIVSHKALKPIRSFFELSHDFGAHEAVFIGRDPRFETIFTAFVHDTRRGLSQGGLRLQNYPNLAEMLTDGLRLSQGMTRKNALAGLNWGGGKGIIQAITGLPLPAKDQPYPEERRTLFHAYGRFVASLGGVYYTAEDMATYTPDMDAILSQNRFTTCISKAIGGSGNPSAHTARGVFRAMLAALRATTGSEDLRGVRVSVQGVGHVGFPLVAMLHDAGCRLAVADFADAVRDKVRSTFPDVSVIDDLDAIYDVEAHIFSPCARTPLTRETIGRLHDAGVRMVCGAANNQLTNPEEDAETLAAMNITYVPDFLCNRMGIVNCADEWRGYLEDDVRLAAEQVYPDTMRVMRQAARLHISTARAADMLADVAAAEVHPLIGHRGRRIVDHLIQTRWASEPEERTDVTRSVFVPQADEPSVHRAAITAGAFTGGPASIAAMPVSTAFAPNLAGFLSPLLADVEARFRSDKPRRIIGVDPAGSALQNAVEQSLPYEREDTSREHLILHCHDRHSKNDALIRAQLERLGIGYDANGWLDPMTGEGPAVVRRLFDRLLAAGLVREDTRLGYRCPKCNTNLVASDVERKERQPVEIFFVRCKVEDGEVEARVARVEYIPHAVGIAVRQESLDGQQASIPGRNGAVPIIFDKTMSVDAELIVPSGIDQHSRFARTHKLARGSCIYDQRDVLMPDGRRLARADAIAAVRAEVGEKLRDATEEREPLRCRYCAAPVDPDLSPQIFVDLRSKSAELADAIARGTFTISSAKARSDVLRQLGDLQPWCISRQDLWGHALPVRPGEVFSPWFSLAAWSLQAAGWPENPMPQPIDVVFSDPQFLSRWIVPSQLVALAAYGNPVFRHVQVHGGVHIVERHLNKIDPHAEGCDEERFVYRTSRRRMEPRRGNVVQPATLVERFGADALRLWYLLSLDEEEVTMDEHAGRVARKAIRRLNGALSSLLGGRVQARDLIMPEDEAIVQEVARFGGQARAAGARRDFAAAARLFIDVAERISEFARAAVDRKTTAGTRAATVAIIHQLDKDFSSVCPFITAVFRREVQ